ncbi:MAG: LytTR family DNA-binding domain-containing protein [Saccharofermentans sp.]|nr:LytTR family DNA-binding domain-containing protein [Saccharofermentans sp.]
MHLALCDDEQVFLDILVGTIREHFDVFESETDTYLSGFSLLEALKSGVSYDALFLDIEMGDIDGLSLAGKIREFLPNIPIIFLTSHTELAIDGYEVSAMRFLKKPVEKDKLFQTLDDLKSMTRGRKGVIIKEAGEEVVIVPSEVLFIESDNNDVRFITTGKTVVARMKLTDAINLLNSVNDTIRRVHRCSAVNMSHVARIRDREKDIALDNGAFVAVSKSYLNEFKDAFREYVRSSVR